ncbi:MAG: glycosyltransferase family 4 protein, partial [Halanaerobiales bacterium]
INCESRFDIKSWIKLYKIIKKNNYDIIHTHHHFTGFLSRFLKLFNLNFKKVHSFGNNFSRFSLPARIIHDMTIFLEDKIICVSQEVKDSFNSFERKIINKKSNVVYNGIKIKEIDREKGKPVNIKGFNFDEDEFVICSVGRFIPQKDQKTLIRGFAKAKKKIENIKLVIVGDGYLKDELKSLVSELNLGNNIYFTGLIERREVYRILHNIDLFVMTSLWEGFSAVVLQAMASYNPIVVTDIPSFKEAIHNGVSGEIISTGSPEALAKAIIKIYENPPLAEKYSNNARKKIVENFTVEKTAEGYKKVYSDLLGCDLLE